MGEFFQLVNSGQSKQFEQNRTDQTVGTVQSLDSKRRVTMLSPNIVRSETHFLNDVQGAEQADSPDRIERLFGGH